MNVSIMLTGIVFLMLIACYSCKKELSCEACREGNSPPIAVAGLDKIIKLPVDSILLDGSFSNDPDGTITSYLWRKIGGPADFTIESPSDSITMIRMLIHGIYQFELNVTDNEGLSSKDTALVTVNVKEQTNRPPIANAGPDRTVTDSLMLDGSGSTDPDNNITSYQWEKVSGPSSPPIANPNVERTLLTNLMEGIYLFELKVTDAEGLFSKDTIQVSVTGKVIDKACDIGSRPLIDVQLLPVTTLPERSGTYFVVHGSKVYFMTTECVNCIGPFKTRAYYNIYDLNTQTWSKSSEFQITPRSRGATLIAAGNRIFHAGGVQSDQTYYFEFVSDVDIYDFTNDTWTTTKLSAGGYDIAAAVVGNTVLFAGGIRYDPYNKAKASAIVDLYNMSANTWSIASLKQARSDITAVTANGKVYFAGGSGGFNASSGALGVTNVIDIYDEATGSWSVSALAEPKARMSGISVGNKVFWAGGLGLWEEWKDYVEIRDVSNQSYSRACLIHHKYWLYNNYGSALVNNNKVVFFTGITTSSYSYNTRFDIYDISNNEWSVGKLPFDVGGASIFSYNNTMYVAGGFINGIQSTRIWKFAF